MPGGRPPKAANAKRTRVQAATAARQVQQGARRQAGKGTGNTARQRATVNTATTGSGYSADGGRGDPAAADDPTAAASSGARTAARAADDPTAAASSSGARTTARADAPRTGATTTRATRAAAGSSRRSTARHKLVPYTRPDAVKYVTKPVAPAAPCNTAAPAACEDGDDMPALVSASDSDSEYYSE